MTDFFEPDHPVFSKVPAGKALTARWALVADSFYSRYGKRMVDIALSSILLVVFLPFFAVLFFLLARDGASPIFIQRRTGLRGREFSCLKFRSMVPDADKRLAEVLAQDPVAAEQWRLRHKLDCDPRITRVGGVLRATSLDELPQLWNVLRGDMSLVGPRPVTRTELDRYGNATAAVLSVRPGMTGLWQVTGRSLGVSYSERVKIDLRYLGSLSFFHDIAILMKTALVVLRRAGS